MSDVANSLLNEDLTPGKAVQISEYITRIVADNGSVMTGAGTNSYLIGKEKLALIDPGPISENHCKQIIAAAQGREISHILLTHTHSDHSPGTPMLQQMTKAKVALFPEPAGKPFNDKPVTADNPLRHEDVLKDFSPAIQAIHTPGHASNHLCFYLAQEKVLFTGDHLMNGSTVVIASPDGNMTHYLDSLALLKRYDIDWLAPGHGVVMDKPFEVVDHTIAHRLKREQKVLQAVEQLQQANIDEVLKLAYADTPSFLHGLAKMSLLAHLEKLQREQKIHCDNTLWKSLS